MKSYQETSTQTNLKNTCPLSMPSSSSPFKEKNKQRRSKTGEHEDDPLAAVKAAAWAWYERGSQSYSPSKPPMTEYCLARTTQKSPPRPSRYKREAMDKSDISTCKQPLMDAYEIEAISKQIEQYSVTPSSSSPAKRNYGDKKEAGKRVRGFLMKRGVVCGRREDVVDARLPRAAREDRMMLLMHPKHASVAKQQN